MLLGDDVYAVESVFALPELQQLYWPIWMSKIAAFAPDARLGNPSDRCESGAAAYKQIYAGQELRLYNCLFQGVSYNGAVKLTVGGFNAATAIKTEDLKMTTANGVVQVVGQVQVTAYDGDRYAVVSSSAIADVEGTIFKHGNFRVQWVEGDTTQFAYDGRLQASDGRYREYRTNRWMAFDGAALQLGDIRWVDHVDGEGALSVERGSLVKTESGAAAPSSQYYSAAELGMPFWDINP